MYMYTRAYTCISVDRDVNVDILRALYRMHVYMYVIVLQESHVALPQANSQASSFIRIKSTQQTAKSARHKFFSATKNHQQPNGVK